MPPKKSPGEYVRITQHRGYENRIPYPHYEIIGHCNDRNLPMYFCKMNPDNKPHFVYSPIFAVQFIYPEDAVTVMNRYKMKNCSVKMVRSDENSNLHGRDIQI